MNSGIAPGYLPKKYCGEAFEEIEVEFVEVGDTIRYWCNRNQAWRHGRVVKIGTKLFHVITAHKVKKVPLNDERIYLIQDKEWFVIVGNR